MPHCSYQHLCTDGEMTSGGIIICCECGQRGAFEGWRLSVIEHWSRFQQTYRLKPIGPHVAMVEELFEGSRRDCEVCDGHGVIGGDEAAWAECPMCVGTGGHWSITTEEVQARLATVVAAHPDAAVVCRPPELIEAARKHARLPMADVAKAFAQAQRELHRRWNLKGKRPCRRATLRSQISRAAAIGADRSFAFIMVGGRRWSSRVFPWAVIKRAAELLEVEVRRLVGQEV